MNDDEALSKKSKSHHKKKDHKRKHKHEHKSKSSKHRDDSAGEKKHKHKKRKHENGNVKGEKFDGQNVSYIDDGPAPKHMKLDENSLQVRVCSLHTEIHSCVQISELPNSSLYNTM